MWPFGRRGGKPARRKASQMTAVTDGPPDATTSSDVLRKTPSRRSSHRRKRKASQRSTASMRDVEKADVVFEKPLAARRSTSLEDITALPLSKHLEQSPHLRPVTNEHAIALSQSQSSLPRERRKLLRPQSLRNPGVTDSLLPARKSTKRKKGHDSAREEEIRVMSMPLPQKRPAGNSQGMLRRDSKKVKGPLNWHFERPTSNISLPLEDSIHSSMSGSSETRAFRVSALDMLSPRPKIRCLVGSQYYYSETRTSPISHQEKQHIGEHDGGLTTSRDRSRRSSRIDDLADTLDAGALRQILERDKRRKEAKRKADDERLKRKLERRAEKQRLAEQRAAEYRAAQTGATRAVARRDDSGAVGPVGLGIERDTPTPMEDVRPSTPPPQQLPAASVSTPKAEENNQLPTPVESPVAEPVVADAKPIRYSRTSMTPSAQVHTREPSNVSEMPALLSEMVARDMAMETVESVHDPRASGSLHPVETADTVVTSKKSSSRRRSSDGGRMAAFASVFRRLSRRRRRPSGDHGRITPSEASFSNTSRESMSRQPLPAHLVAPPSQPIQIKRPTSIPRRTMSKFREDLPEYPMSPPDSRIQSPEVASAGASAARRRSQHLSDLQVNSESPETETLKDSPVSPGVPATGVMSQSLASVDSEGSWLSGKPMKRISNRSQMRSSIGSSAAAKRNEDFNASYEELGIPDDEYFRRLTPQPDDRRSSANSSSHMVRKASSTVMAPMDPTAESTSSDEELVKNSVGRQPTIVHRQPRVKSTEGLLSYYQADKSSPGEEESSVVIGDEPTESAEPDSPTSEGEPVVLQRAQSVDLGKHHTRQLSAGSAKLLDIPARRTSVDPKRSSLASQNTVSHQ